MALYGSYGAAALAANAHNWPSYQQQQVIGEEVSYRKNMQVHLFQIAPWPPGSGAPSKLKKETNTEQRLSGDTESAPASTVEASTSA